ncbi:MAG: family 10 glycosylhydrolase [Armatimonadota bacterium]|nr:family 10 glycosylhydrolase [Armatimonadota bacterium]
MKKGLWLSITFLVLLIISPCLYGAVEIIIDNPGAVFVNGSNAWTTGTSATDKYGSDYRYCKIATAGGSTATYTPFIPQTAPDWQVYTWYCNTEVSETTAAQYIIHHASGDTVVYVNQTTNRGTWFLVGTYTMNAGSGNYARISNQGSSTTRYVVADGMRFYSATATDTTPPTISNVSASPGVTTATITWTTNEPSTSQVEYGLTTSYGNQTPKDTNLVTSHSVLISGLSPTTLYHYRVKSADASNNEAVSSDYTFTTTAPTPEYRANWVDTWHDGILSAEQITNLVNIHKLYNYNVIIPEVRKCGDAYYNSTFEPRASNIIDAPPFDPLGDLIQKAHAQGIEVHPWIVTYRIWNSGWGAAPANHIWTLHPEWAMTDSSGNNLDGQYYNLDPGVPGVQDYIYKVVMDIVNQYDIDGFNWDYIRYPGYNWGYNSITQQRFYNEYGYWPPTSTSDSRWNTWSDFRRRQVTDLLKKCHVQIWAKKPNVKTSVDTVGWMGADPNVDFTQTRQYKEVFQDGKGWMEQHIVDVNILMNYKREYDTAQKQDYRLWTNWLATMQATTGRHSVDGQACYLNSISDSIIQMQVARDAGLAGICNYSYAVTNKDGQPSESFWSAVKSNLYTLPVPTPNMPWKSNPTTGCIFGVVTNASNPNDPIYYNWVYKATVTVTGPVTRSTETDATGFYAFLDLPPGTYTITCSKTGLPPYTYYNQTLAAGQYLRENFALGYTQKTSYNGIVRAGWNLISLPLDPVNPDPAVVFNGIDIEGKLYRYDNPTASFITYDPWTPEIFGNCRVGEGYWLFADGPKTISYQAWASFPPARDIQIPAAGWALIGCPFPNGKYWADTNVTKDGNTVSLATAAKTNGWLDSVGWWWDNSAQALQTLGLPEDWPASEYLVPWYGYWINTYTSNLTLTVQ